MKPKNQNDYVEPYYQVPRIVAEFDKMTNDHQSIFMHLYDQLRQRKEWNKSNPELSVLARVGLTQLKQKLNDLEKWGFLERKGMGHNRKFSLGLKFNNRSESAPDKKSNRPESNPVLAGNRPSTGLDSGYIDKNIFKNIINSSAHAIKTPTPKVKTFEPLSPEDKKLVQDFYYDLKHPNEPPCIKPEDFNRAKALHDREKKGAQ